MNSAENERAIMLSNWYSGATLLAILLNRHSSILCNGETFPFSPIDQTRYDCSCGKYLDECPFYQRAANHMWLEDVGDWDREVFCQIPKYSHIRLFNSWLLSANRQGRLTRAVLQSSPRLLEFNRRYVEAHFRFVSQALAYSNKSVYVDGTKSIRRAQLFADSSTKRQKTIHLVRDGRGFCLSYLKNSDIRKNDLDKAIDEWMGYLSLIQDLERRYPTIDIKTIRYEDLCRDPEGQMKEIFEFLRLSYEDVVKTPVQIEEHILGNRMRRSGLKEIVEDLRWTTEFDRETQRTLTSKMEKGLVRFGYI